ncbi:MAG: hypothetical protein M1815_003316 [Lichina confinis]|nr:MAG: hypothetical protein M1815_003316 [Lichina confinis]
MRPGFVPSTQTSRHLASLQANAAHNAQGGDVVPLHPPPFDTNTPAYTMSTPMSLPPTGTSATTGLPTLPAQHSYMGNTMLSQQFPSSRTPSHLSPAHHAQGLVTPRMPRTQACYPGVHPASAPAHQTSFSSSSTGASPPHQSPGSTGSAPRLSPGSPTAHRMSLLHPTPGPTPAVAHLPRSLSISHLAMPSPMAPGLQGPGTPIGYAGAPSPGLAHIYGNHGTFVRTYPGGPRPTPPQRQNERPFKCNQCPQSFNRNHDLKRHKRIHLAVKPFPCRHCDKSFSRKDALKRHILVKGCGKAQPVNATDGHDDASSTHEQSEIMSGEEDAGESPGIGSHLAYQPGPS